MWLLHGWRARRRLAQRGLFRYHDGQRIRWGDPFALWRGLVNHPEMNLETMAPLVDEGQEPETSIVLNATAEVFGVQRWDSQAGAGLTDWEILGLLTALQEYLAALKKNTSPGRTSAEPTGPPPCSDFPGPPSQATSASSDSGSTPSE